jgi:hypothetical protein
MALSEEDRYDFDVMGWLTVPAVLAPEQIQQVASGLALHDEAAATTATTLAETAPLPLFLHEFMATFPGQGVELDGCRLVEHASDWETTPALDAAGVWWPARSWRQKNGFRWGQRLVAVFALESTDALHLIRGSHLAELPPTREALRPSSELWEPVALTAGDLLVCSAGLLSSIHTTKLSVKLAVCEFVGPFVRPMRPYLPAISEPIWATRLSATQRALLQHRWSDETANPPVLSDGCNSWLGTTTDTHQAYALSNDSAHLVGDPTEMYQWDLQGFLVLRNIMNQAWIERALASLEPRAECVDKLNRSFLGMAYVPGGCVSVR